MGWHWYGYRVIDIQKWPVGKLIALICAAATNRFLTAYSIVGIVIMLTGCGDRAGGGMMATQYQGAPLVVDLPALYIDYDPAGAAHIGSVPVISVGDALGIDLSPLDLEATQVARLVDANIQHIQITTTPSQLLILINGRLVPSLVWSVDELEQAGATLSLLAPSLTPLEPLLPVAAEIGGGLVLRFPVAPGSASLPLTATPNVNTVAQDHQAAYLAAIGGLPPRWVVELYYAPDGTWTMDDLSAAGWRAIVPLPWERLNLDSTQIDALRAGGVEDVVLASNRDGLSLQMNGKPLPHLSWTDGELQNLLVVAEEGGIFRELLGDTPTAYSLATTLERLLPMLQLTEVELHVHFPTSEYTGGRD